jgi:periplasmic divalent cation tolerance protein
VPAIVKCAEDEHPYDVPCVIARPVITSNPAYAQWVIDESTDAI